MTEFKIGDKVLVKPGEVSLTGWTPEDYTTPLPVTHVDDYGRVVSLAGVLEYSFRPEQLTPAPLDPSKVKPGDTVTLESVLEAPFKVTGVVEKIDITLFDADGLAVAFNVMIWSRWFTVGINLRLTAHQPAPEPEPEWKPGTVLLGNLPGVGTDERYWVVDDGETDPHVVDDTGVKHYAADLLNVREAVVIDPDDVDVEALTETFHNASRYAIDLSIAGSAYLVRLALEHLGVAR
jgi:hypothetical protein